MKQKIVNTKICTTCKERKTLDEFAVAKNCKDGHRGQCKICRAKTEKENWKNTSHRASRDPEYKRRERFKRKYNLTLEEYNNLLKVQGNVCAICLKPSAWNRREGERLVVDHDHTTGKVRGLLCHACNQGIGLLREQPHILFAAIQYLNMLP